MAGGRLLTAAQAAEILKRDVSVVRDLCRRGLLLGAERYGPMWLIPEESVREMAATPRLPGRPRRKP